ncbi:oligosaccharide flippase family protein [Clostridium sp. Ade.TY]|uniref:oligosaccharide flippase family protein n=1 Tax=Clostridium sp. Ade.TY TaxID=1391647 RepID=UPI0004180CD2|nr:oligosaccharide flippase family protein [Clostridium sp. Ade.TY]
MQKSIAKNFVYKFILNLFNIVVPILVGPYLARTLGPENMGVFNYSNAVFGYFFIFASFGVYQYGVRELSNNRNDNEKYRKVFTNIFLISVITNILALLVYLIFINGAYSDDILYVPCMILSFDFFSNIFYVEWVNESLESYNFISIKTIIIRIVYVVLLFIMVEGSDNLNEYMLLLCFTTFLNNIVSYIYVKRRIKFKFKDFEVKKHLKGMFFVVILSNITVLYTQLDKLVIGKYINMEAVAFYSVAQSITRIISGLMQTFINVTIPRLNYYLSNDEENNYIELLNKVSGIYFLFLFPVCIGMFVLSKEIIALYGGDAYLGATSVFAIFSIYVITLGYESILANQIMYVKGRERGLVRIDIIGGIFNLISNYILVFLNILTPVTAILTTMVANIIIIILQNYYTREKLKVNFKIFSLDKTKYLIISLVFIPITIFIKSMVTGIIRISIITVFINALIYFLILYISKDKVFTEILNIVKRRFGGDNE